MAKPFEPDEDVIAWAAECLVSLDDPTVPGATLDAPSRSYALWLADRMLPSPAKTVSDAKRHLKHLGYAQTRTKGSPTRWKGVRVEWPSLPEVDSDATLAVSSVASEGAEPDPIDVYVGLGALVRTGMVTPKQADLAYVHLVDTPYALCSTCGMLTHRVAERHHVGCGQEEAS